MKENKLGIYLTSFTDKDWVLYHNFSKGLYSDKSDYQLVINYLKKHKKRIDLSLLDAEVLRKKIRPTADRQVFANAISKLCKYIEQYFTWSEVENDPLMKDTLLLKALGKRGLSNQFYKHKEKSKKNRDAHPNGLWNNYHDFMAEYLLYYCNMTSDIGVSKVSLEQAHLELKKFFDTINGYLGVEMHNRSILLKEDWDSLLIDHSTLSDDNLVHIIFKHLVLLKQNKEEQDYFFLKQILENEDLSSDISYTVIIHLTSFLNGETVRGNKKFIPELLNLYNYGIEKNIIFPNGKIPIIRFLNMILLACGVEEFDWAISFVNKYSKFVGNELEMPAKKLGFAHIAFSKKHFSKVILILREIKYKDFEFEIRAKWLLLSSHYELNKDNPDSVEYAINSFTYFVRRNRHKTIVSGAESFIKSALFLLKITKTIDPIKTLGKIKKENHLLYRRWLSRKIEEKIKTRDKVN